MQLTETSLKDLLTTDCQAFVDATNHLSDEQFTQHLSGKWSVADVMQHLYLSARPVARLMTGPRNVLMQWGKADTPSRTYDEIAVNYAKVLGTGAKAPGTMSPRLEDMQVGKNVLVERFTSVYQMLADAIGSWSDQELDTYCMPHPVLGKLTVREMMIFTSVHTRHHLRLLFK